MTQLPDQQDHGAIANVLAALGFLLGACGTWLMRRAKRHPRPYVSITAQEMQETMNRSIDPLIRQMDQLSNDLRGEMAGNRGELQQINQRVGRLEGTVRGMSERLVSLESGG